ncbi:hypothetical protein [Dokdonia sp. Hel_I_53]|uniref:hypothetical protein n=1 Tax=Dokdonia sp. Hel_I_53 TaxID=1566287 RepID=UPI0011993277|nr:hypothetical protein [Dokdonia sp. Hel_I_53]TVZ51448.1 hypothetical protein OD90_0591 [Dokdonia sp. Hel_I_53]
MKTSIIKKGFIAAGLSNIVGVLLFSKLFTNQILMNQDPEVMGAFGLVMIMFWGLAFIAASDKFQSLRWLVGVFILEKISYVIAYVIWFSNNSILEVYEKDFFAGIFYSVYGLNDFIFFLFFSYVFLKLKK